MRLNVYAFVLLSIYHHKVPCSAKDISPSFAEPVFLEMAALKFGVKAAPSQVYVDKMTAAEMKGQVRLRA